MPVIKITGPDRETPHEETVTELIQLVWACKALQYAGWSLALFAIILASINNNNH